ncbi:hypothetical protein BDV19DRAFT_362405 [Aspergillus venezuelensis]
MSPRKILVFGATGGVGSAVARSASSHGSKVFLAMRDTSKSIPGLTTADEEAAGYERLQADLNKPDSVREAVSKTGVTHAFIYALLGGGSSDYLLSTVKALKESGIEQVVLLSSYSVQGDIRSIPSSNFIAHGHAQVEVSLDDVFGPQGYVAVRPAFFASNTLWWKSQILEGDVKWVAPDLKLDYISPNDIGEVCGTILAGAFEGAHESPVCLCGPETDLSVADAIGIIGRAIDRPVKVAKVDIDENIQIMIRSGMSKPEATLVINTFASMGERLHVSPEHQANIERYLKRPATRFSEWAEQNKDKFAA